MIGFLAPSGEFHECSSHEHTWLAPLILEKIGLEPTYNGITDEDTLLKLGYIVLRARDAYRGEWDTIKHMPRAITDEQISFLMTKVEETTTAQYNDISRMLEDDKEYKSCVKSEVKTFTSNVVPDFDKQDWEYPMGEGN